MDQTKGHVMVMGRTTWQDSQLGHPVPDRLSYVVTRNPDNCPEADGVIQGDIVQRILDLQHVHQGQDDLDHWWCHTDRGDTLNY